MQEIHNLKNGPVFYGPPIRLQQQDRQWKMPENGTEERLLKFIRRFLSENQRMSVHRQRIKLIT